MLSNNQIPSDIALMIEQKQAAMLDAETKQKQAEQQKLEEAQVRGQIKVNEWLAQS
jgi:hypothetical protein